MDPACVLLERLAADLVDARSIRDGAPWCLIASELDALHRLGCDLANLAAAVRHDLGGGEPVDSAMPMTATMGSGSPG